MMTMTELVVGASREVCRTTPHSRTKTAIKTLVHPIAHTRLCLRLLATSSSSSFSFMSAVNYARKISAAGGQGRADEHTHTAEKVPSVRMCVCVYVCVGTWRRCSRKGHDLRIRAHVQHVQRPAVERPACVCASGLFALGASA